MNNAKINIVLAYASMVFQLECIENYGENNMQIEKQIKKINSQVFNINVALYNNKHNNNGSICPKCGHGNMSLHANNHYARIHCHYCKNEEYYMRLNKNDTS